MGNILKPMTDLTDEDRAIYFLYLTSTKIKRTKAQQNLTIIQICTQAQRIKNILSTLFKKIKADQFKTNSVSHITAQITNTVWFYFPNYTPVVRFLFKKTIKINQLQPSPLIPLLDF